MKLFLTLVLLLASVVAQAASIPPAEEQAKAVLEKSSRHGEYTDVNIPGSPQAIRTWIVYPERKDKAPIVLIIHEIFGLSDWIRAVADQLAADGFIAVAPDLLAGHGANGGDSSSLANQQEMTQATLGLPAAEIAAKLKAAREYGNKLPNANGKSGSVGF